MKRKKTNAKRKQLAVAVQPVVGRFLVVSAPAVDDPLKEVTGDIEGTFDTIQQAENYIREEGRDSFNLDGANEGRNEDWCTAMFICEVVAVRKAIPIVSVRVEVADAVPTPNARYSSKKGKVNDEYVYRRCQVSGCSFAGFGSRVGQDRSGLPAPCDGINIRRKFCDGGRIPQAK